jgi:hypothetical protein
MKHLSTFENFLNEASSSNKEFWRLPDKVVGTELYRAQKGLDSLYSTLAAGNDLDMGALENIIDLLQKTKKQAKKFKSAEEIKGTVYESTLDEADGEVITLSLTDTAAKSVGKELDSNGVKYKMIRPTVFELVDSPKVRMAIKLAKERFGSSAVMVESTLDEAYRNIPGDVKIAGEYEITSGSEVIKTKISRFEREGDDTDALVFADDKYRGTFGSLTVKNSDMFKLQKGTEVKAKGSKNSKEVKIKRVGDL